MDRARDGFGAWMRSVAAGGLALALALPCFGLGRAAPFLPGSDLFLALGETGAGLVPRALAPTPSLAGLTLFALTGLFLARRGLDAGAADCEDMDDVRNT